MALPKRQVPQRGPLDSSEMNAFIEDVQTEIERVTEIIAETESGLSRRRIDDALSRAAGANGNYQRRHERWVELAAQVPAIIGTSTQQQQIYSFFDTDGVHYIVDDGVGGTTEFPVANRCPVDTKFGQVTLPSNGTKSLFWSATADTEGESLYLPEVRVSYVQQTPVAADKVTASDPRNAFDGSSLDPYLIRAVYPLDADIEEVIFDIYIQVPDKIERRANVLTVEPAPELKCSISQITYSPTAVIPNLPVTGIPTINRNNPISDINPKRWFFPTTNFASLGIRLTSKHYEIENGRKVFYVGFREVGLYLVDWDTTWSNSPGAFTNNGLIVKLEVPKVEGINSAGYFDDITAVYTTREMATSVVAAGTSTGVRVTIFEDDTLGAVAFDSVGGSFPYTVSGNRDHLWMAIELDRNNAAGLVPYLSNLVVNYTIKA